MKIAFRPHRALQTVAALSVLALAGCYVVPMQPAPVTGGPTVVVPAAPPAPVTFTARLYPANELAGVYGVVAAVVTNDLNGRGHFSTAIGGESFMGEATRVAGSPKDGVANGAGSRGSFLSCRYTMNSPTLGTGNCRHSDGAQFSMHIGS
ncbi:hypothetical protein [Ramlibacter sp. AN1133]|uniref:hypothetical protein n=1 Tax=Ramlibacter sp. AN1133 TaxID=3133429 RepID=UPI0030C0FA81